MYLSDSDKSKNSDIRETATNRIQGVVRYFFSIFFEKSGRFEAKYLTESRYVGAH
jgi:hypothetical protein